MKNKIFILLFIIVCQSGMAQSWNQNFIRVRSPKTKINSIDVLDSKSIFKDSVSTDIQYFDGLGRPKQNVNVFASPQGKDVITPIKYDYLGLESRKYLPYVSDTYDGTYKVYDESEQATFYSSGSPKCITDGKPYSKITFEPSPLNRPSLQFGPGQNWHDSNRSTEKTYLSNTTGEVKQWIISGMSSNGSSTYAAGALYKTQTTDENGNKSWEYTDKKGRIILKKVESDINIFLNTYYVYDDLDRLVYVIPPKATGNIYTENSTGFNELIYAYHYDERGRVKEKYIPGAGWTYLVYNQIDQLILSQDANQGASNTWIFTKYDGLGRVIMTGSMVIPGTTCHASKLRALCLAKMKQVWNTDISSRSQFPFLDLAKKRFLNSGGVLDRTGHVPYDAYIELLGKYFCSFNPIVEFI